MKLKEIKEKLDGFNTYSVRDGIITVRREFFYRHGKTSQDMVNKVLSAFPDAIIIDSGEIWKAFNGGASVANSSHWFVKFRI